MRKKPKYVRLWYYLLKRMQETHGLDGDIAALEARRIYNYVTKYYK